MAIYRNKKHINYTNNIFTGANLGGANGQQPLAVQSKGQQNKYMKLKKKFAPNNF